MTRIRLLGWALSFALVASAAGAHSTADPSQPVPGQRLLLKERKFVFRMANGASWLPTDVDPRTIETGLLVSGSDGRSALCPSPIRSWWSRSIRPPRARACRSASRRARSPPRPRARSAWPCTST